MSHADTLRKHAAGYTGLRGYEDLAAAAIAGAEALEAAGRVRHALNSITSVKADSEAARDHGYDNVEWHETTADALEYVIDLLTEALEGDLE